MIVFKELAISFEDYLVLIKKIFFRKLTIVSKGGLRISEEEIFYVSYDNQDNLIIAPSRGLHNDKIHLVINDATKAIAKITKEDGAYTIILRSGDRIYLL